MTDAPLSFHDAVPKALREAVLKAAERAKRAGTPLAIEKNEKIQLIQPENIDAYLEKVLGSDHS